MKTTVSKMKTIGSIAAFLGLLMTSSGAKAQAAYQIGNNVISASFGLGSAYGSFNSSKQSPAINLQYERGIWQAGPGVISLGAYLGYKSYRYSGTFPGGYTYSQRWNYTIIGARGAWHIQEFDGTELKKWDLYGGVMLSYNILDYTYSDNDPTFELSDVHYSSGMGLSAFLGARYFFNDHFAAQGELGYGISYLNLGIAYKF